jgi:hypothetical protein
MADSDLERMAKAICLAWPKVPDGCAARCMDRLGEIPKEGCKYALAVHGERARRVLSMSSEDVFAEVEREIREMCTRPEPDPITAVLNGRIEELECSFNLRWTADMRAIERWQKATGKTLTWPDHADLVVWLLGQVEASDALLLRCKRFLQHGDPEKDYSHLKEPEEIADAITADCLAAAKRGEQLYKDLCAALKKPIPSKG